jgi:hypothetical protein
LGPRCRPCGWISVSSGPCGRRSRGRVSTQQARDARGARLQRRERANQGLEGVGLNGRRPRAGLWRRAPTTRTRSTVGRQGLRLEGSTWVAIPGG